MFGLHPQDTLCYFMKCQNQVFFLHLMKRCTHGFHKDSSLCQKKPTKIDYIFTSEELLTISDGERISADLLYSDHCLLKIHGKTGKQSSKTKRFPDEMLDSEKGRLQVEKYGREQSKIVET